MVECNQLYLLIWIHRVSLSVRLHIEDVRNKNGKVVVEMTHDEQLMKFSEQLIRLRKDKGLSQEVLAELIGVSRQAISKWETGATQPEMGNIIKLCEIFEVNPNILFGLEEAREPVSDEISEENDNGGETKRINGKQRLIITVLAVCCILLGMMLGFLVKSNSMGEEGQQDIPIEFSVSGFDLHSEAYADGVKTFRLNFASNISNPEYNYKIIVTDHNGISREFDVRAGADGVYTGTFQTDGQYIPYLISVSVSVGENTYTDPLIKISNISESGYLWEEVDD